MSTTCSSSIEISIEAAPAPAPPPGTLRVFPFALRAGDRLTIAGSEWEVAEHPASYQGGKMIRVRLRKRGDATVADEQHWPAP